MTDRLRLRADFNGLFGDILCLSHDDTCRDQFGNVIELKAGLRAIAFDEDFDEHGQRDDLLASGIVETSPAWLQCNGSRWCLKIDQFGVRHESDIKPDRDE
jgi:hypothetical protein